MKRLLLIGLLLLPHFAQAQASLLPFVEGSFIDSLGLPVASGFICTTISGTTTNLATYPTQADANAGTNANANPVVLDSAGRANIFIGTGTYRIVLFNPVGIGSGTCNGTTTGSAVKTVDGVAGFGSLLAANNTWTGTNSFTGSVITTTFNNREFCITGATMGAKIIAAAALLPSTGGIVDCSNLQGAQTINAQVNITKPILLLLGQVSAICSASVCFNSTAAFSIMGAGRDISRILNSNGTQTLFQHAAVEAFELSNLSIQGTSGSQTAGAAVSLTGAGGSNSNLRSIIDNVHFLYQYVSVDIHNAGYSKTINCDFNGVQLAGVRINNTYSSDEGDHLVASNLFSPDAAVNAYGIELISGAGLRAANNKFQENFLYGTYVHWVGTGVQPDTVIFNYVGNVHEWPLTNGAAIYFDGTTGSLVDIVITGNRFISTGNAENGIQFAANSRQVFSRATITGNHFDFIAGTSTMVAFGGYANGDVAEISGNVMYGGLGTGTAVTVAQTTGTLYSAINPGQNNYQGAIEYTQTGNPADARFGFFIPDRVWIGDHSTATPPNGGTLSDAITVPNSAGLSARNAANNASKSLIRLNSGDAVEIGASNSNIVTGTGTFLSQGAFTALSVEVSGGGSNTISTGVGSVKMSTANPATNVVWIPLVYAGVTYFVPAWTTNAP